MVMEARGPAVRAEDRVPFTTAEAREEIAAGARAGASDPRDPASLCAGAGLEPCPASLPSGARSLVVGRALLFADADESPPPLLMALAGELLRRSGLPFADIDARLLAESLAPGR